MITFAGTLFDYAKTLELQWKANQKIIKTAAPQITVSSTAEQIREQLGDLRISGITIRMMAGKRLSDADLEYLRKNNPGLYAQAMKIKREREAYEKEIKKCRTKEEVRQAHMRKIQGFMPEIRQAEAGNDQGGMAELQMRVNAICDEYTRYTSSKAFERLPENLEELRRRRRKNIDSDKGGKPRPGGVIVELSGHRPEVYGKVK